MFLRSPVCVLGAALVLGSSGCAHVQTVGHLEEKLEQVPGGYVSGEIVSLDRRALLDRKDFIYTIAVDPSSTRAAYTHLAGKTFNLAVWDFGEKKPQKLADVATNDYQFDVEGLDYSPDEKFIATAGRDGAIRIFDAHDAHAVNLFSAEEPLVSVAFLPDGKHLVAGSAHGMLLVLNWPELSFASELRAHSDEVRALAVTPSGHVVSGGWDKTIAEFALVEGPLQVDELHLIVAESEKTPVVRAGLDGHVAPFAFDATLPFVVVSSALAKEAGIQESLLTDLVTVNGRGARLAKGHAVNLKQVMLTGVDVAVCSSCVPNGAEGILGAPVLSAYDIRSTDQELVLTAKQKHDPSTLPRTTVLQRVAQHGFDSFVNDFSIDRQGKRLGVAFSAEKAERNREVYQREKKGIPAPFNEGDFAGIVELETGKVLRAFRPHLGIVSTVGISPDGRAVASGGWDKNLFLSEEGDEKPRLHQEFGWSLRRVRFSPDGRFLAIAAWTPQNAVGSQESDPSAVIDEVGYSSASVLPAP